MTILEALRTVTERVKSWTEKKVVNQAIVATSEDGVAYTVTVPGITELTAGVSFIMIPSVVSTSKTPTLNVNGLGAKGIRRRLSNLPTSLQTGYSASWLTANKPFRIVYDGSVWIVEGLSRPSASDLHGAVPEAKKAINDSAEQEIVSTYIKGLSVGLDSITCTKGDDTTETVSLSSLIQSLLPKVTNITLDANSWVGSVAPYRQDVELSYVTETTKVDLQPTAEQLASWQENGLAFSTLSLAGSVRVYVSDIKPTEDISVQITIQEVVEV